MKKKHNWLILSATLSATLSVSANAKEYVVNLYTDVPQVVEVDLIDEVGNSSPLITSMEYQLGAGPLAGEVLFVNDIFENHKLSSNVQGIEFEVSRVVSSLTAPDGVDTSNIRSRLTIDSSNCDEDIPGASSETFQANVPSSLLTSTLSEGGKLCKTAVSHEIYSKKFPSGHYNAEFKLNISPKI
ncbi:hypothetical protein NB620_21575 [Vibrio alginolyticus]|uniref:hypothetical protein n=1 Tax=Vibrio alginolyticus TaxID=663 RepID=UPI00215B7BC9|nr:hypothetical protein [Vibrio alginolyticus]MCS0002859.1 hypothetical protein [Vibrio alginolyticus]